MVRVGQVLGRAHDLGPWRGKDAIRSSAYRDHNASDPTHPNPARSSLSGFFVNRFKPATYASSMRRRSYATHQRAIPGNLGFWSLPNL